jgi:hypothetical protein
MGLAMAASAGLAGAILARSGIDAFGLSACVAGIIWAIDSAALAIIAVTPSGLRRVNSVLFAMLIRLAGPLSAVVYLSSTGQEAARPGLMGLVLVHYLVGLASLIERAWIRHRTNLTLE